MIDLNLLIKAADQLDAAGFEIEASTLDKIISKVAKKEKWMQKAVNPKEKGELHRKLNVPENQEIPVSKLHAKKKELQAKGEGDKTLSESDRETLSQIQFALNARKTKK